MLLYQILEEFFKTSEIVQAAQLQIVWPGDTPTRHGNSLYSE